VSLVTESTPSGLLNRELSWVEFNARVLELAEDRSLPLLERVKFAAIYAQNLDEFFMVRVAGLLEVDEAGLGVRSTDGLTALGRDGRRFDVAYIDGSHLAADVKSELAAIASRRGTSHTLEESMRVAAAPSAPEWQRRWEAVVAALGLPVHRMPSGAGHDAMKLHEIMPQAMLFVRGLNSGISHNPLESSTSDDMQLAVDAFLHLLNQLSNTTP